jgi:PAS domain S-box-containing protein
LSTDKDIFLRALNREKRARKVTEQSLEKKSYELLIANNKLQEINANLESMVKKRTLELQQTEERFFKMVDSASDLIYRGNRKGTLNYANTTTIEKLGYSIEELRSMHFTAFIRKDSIQSVIDFYMNQLREKKVETYLEFPAESKSGKTIWLGQNVIFTFSDKGRFTGLSAVTRDITEQQETLTIIQQSEEKYRNIISNMNLGLMEVDLEDRIIQTNQSFCEMIGYSSEELMGQVASEAILKGENADLMVEKNASRKKGISNAYEIRVKNKSGNIRWWLISGGPLYNDRGEQTGSLGIHLDITQQKKLEIELNQAKEDAESSNRSKEVFLANMSHEIRTPMNGILGMARQLEKSSLNLDQKFYLNTITSAADDLLIILNDILDISKIEAGKLQIENTHLDIADVAQRTKNILSAKAEEKGLKFNVFIDKSISISLSGDPTRLNQVLINLAGNSVKFTEKGTVTIECKLINEDSERQLIEFNIRDTGIGMSEEYIDTIFDKFTQEDKTVTRKYGGTGLGMSISKQLLELMGSELTIQSHQGVGTAIIFQLELDKIEESNNSSSKVYKYDPEQIQEKVKGKKILIAEDNEMNQLVVCTSLDFIGLQYDIANDGAEAIEAIQKNEYDLILMDINMPIMDGIKATKIIRNEYNRKIPIIALTANAMEGTSKRYLQAGMTDYLAKPFVEEELFDILHKWIVNESSKNKTEVAPEPISAELYNLAKLEKISRGNQAFVDKMLNLFVTHITQALHEINTAYAAKDLETVYKTAHRIKPTLSDLDITHSKDQIIEIEKLAKAGKDSEELSQLISAVKDNVSKVVLAIQKTLSPSN